MKPKEIAQYKKNTPFGGTETFFIYEGGYELVLTENRNGETVFAKLDSNGGIVKTFDQMEILNGKLQQSLIQHMN